MSLTHNTNPAEILQWNIGLSHKTKAAKLLSFYNPVLCINEGNFAPDFSLPGFVMYVDEHAAKSRATIFVRTKLPQTRLSLPKVEGVHASGCTVVLNGTRLNILTVYISPNVQVGKQELQSCLLSHVWDIVTGDMNGKNEAWGSKKKL